MAVVTIGEILASIAACVCAELTPDGADGPDVCFCDVVPGQVFAHDYVWGCEADGKCGAAWVRMITAYPAVGVGVPADKRPGCGFLLGVDVEIGVIRCLEAGENGNAPEAEVMNAAAMQEIDDMIAIRRAIMCCDALEDIDISLGNYQPTGPAGMVFGGTWALSLAL
jgi:hypothetical protein